MYYNSKIHFFSQVVRPTIVSTVILTEYETSTIRQTVTNTIVIEPRPATSVSFPQGPSFSFGNVPSFNDAVFRSGNAPSVSASFQSFSGTQTQARRELERNHDLLFAKQIELIEQAEKYPSESTLIAILKAQLTSLIQSRNVLIDNDRKLYQIKVSKDQRLAGAKLNELARLADKHRSHRYY